MDKKREYVEIDLLQIFKALWRRIGLIILTVAAAGAIAFGYTKLMVTPLYSARTLLYVNNSSISLGGTEVSISQGDLTAAKSLVDTYTVILKTRLTLEDVIEKAHLPYSYEELSRMISSAAVNSTEVFYIEVTSPDPQEAELIANTIGQVLPEKISSIVEGSSVRIVDYAVTPSVQSSPNTAKNVALGMLLGAVIICAVIVIRELSDNQIHDTDYLQQSYDIPILATIPELYTSGKSADYYEYEAYGQGDKKHD